ncbi:MAG: MBL fold metallo-hydrolase [Gammaproteobacteria bacterium]
MQIAQLEEIINTARGGALYEESGHQFLWLGLDEMEEGNIIQVNQYVVRHGKRCIILDPGGAYTYATVVANLSRYFNLDEIDTLFFSHQDPDVCSGMGLWLNTTRAKVMVSRLWTSFLPHFGGVDSGRIEAIPDKGMRVDLGGSDYLHFIPAHFLHSIGNFSVYDSRSKILFSGDIGASVFGPGNFQPLVDDLAQHVQRMEGFHKRYMCSNMVCKEWVRRVSQYDIKTIAPQHGAIMVGDAVPKFFDWFSRLSCGMDNLQAIYG